MLAVTIAICTRNRCELLSGTLQSLVEMQAPPDVTWTVMVVDNGSTDGTASVVRRYENSLPLRHLHEATPGLSFARNRVLEESADDYILWTDDDVRVDPQWLVELASAARRYPQAAMIGGKIVPDFERPPDPELTAVFPALAMGFCGLDHNRPPGELPQPEEIWGANMAFRREGIGGRRFDTRLGPSPTGGVGGEETDLQARVRGDGGAIIWWPQMMVRHWVPKDRMTLSYLRRYTKSKGRDAVIIAADERSLGTVPVWLLREWAQAFVRERLATLGLPIGLPERLRSGRYPIKSANKRVTALLAVRERMYLEGMVVGSREIRREPRRGAR